MPSHTPLIGKHLPHTSIDWLLSYLHSLQLICTVPLHEYCSLSLFNFIEMPLFIKSVLIKLVSRLHSYIRVLRRVRNETKYPLRSKILVAYLHRMLFHNRLPYSWVCLVNGVSEYLAHCWDRLEWIFSILASSSEFDWWTVSRHLPHCWVCVSNSIKILSSLLKKLI